MALSAPQGVFNAIEEQGDFIDENIISLGGLEFTKEQALLLVSPQAVVDLEKQKKENSKLRFQDFIPTFVPPSKWKSEEYSKKRQLPTFHKPETLAGNMTEGISRFLTGYAGPAKFLKGAGLAGTSLKGTFNSSPDFKFIINLPLSIFILVNSLISFLNCSLTNLIISS